MSDNYTLTVKRAKVNFTVDRKDVMAINETPDGITLKFQGGVLVTIDDVHMPLDVKQRVGNVDTSFKKGNIIINLNDYRNPVLVEY